MIPKYFFLAALCLLTRTGSHAQLPSFSVFERLQGLTGVWIMKNDKRQVYEDWRRVNDSTLAGRSYTVNRQDTVLLEEMRLFRRDASLYFEATTTGEPGQGTVRFTAVSTDEKEVVFENKQHDFPQRIGYAFPVERHFSAWIEGTINQTKKRSAYSFERPTTLH